MGTVPVGAAGGAVTGQANKGLPVLGGQMGKNQFSPASGIPGTTPLPGPNNGVRPVNTTPGTAAGTTGMPTPTIPGAMNAGGAMTGAPPTAIATPPVATSTTGAAAAPGAAGNNGNTLAGYTPQQTQQLQKQLNDMYGKGEGGIMFSLLSNLGSNDSSYMDAYHTAMAKTQAEGMSTIDTGLGNAGISANSSTAAIEKGDYLSGLSAQEGMQEQQLIQNQQSEAINLVQGMQSDASAENSTSWLNTAAQVVGIGATLAGVPGAAGSLPGLFKTGGGTVPALSGNASAGSAGAGATLPGAISGGYPGAMPIGIG